MACYDLPIFHDLNEKLNSKKSKQFKTISRAFVFSQMFINMTAIDFPSPPGGADKQQNNHQAGARVQEGDTKRSGVGVQSSLKTTVQKVEKQRLLL